MLFRDLDAAPGLESKRDSSLRSERHQKLSLSAVIRLRIRGVSNEDYRSGNNFIRTNFHRHLQQALTFAAPCRIPFCMYPYGKSENRSFKKSTYPLRVQASLMDEARKVAKSEGASLPSV